MDLPTLEVETGPQPQAGPLRSASVCPKCPARPPDPVSNLPLLITPPPTPVDTVINTMSLISSAIAWYSAQAAACADASLAGGMGLVQNHGLIETACKACAWRNELGITQGN